MRHILAVFLLILALAHIGGCEGMARGPTKETPRRLGGADEGVRVTSAELDELTRAFADRYVGTLHSVCEKIRSGNPDPTQRREIQALLVDCATNVYDIASNADSFTRVLDLVVVTSLLAHVWVDEGRARALFGERAEPLTQSMRDASTEASALAGRVLRREQIELLHALLRDWRAENPGMTSASFVRFSNFAIGRGMSAASEVLAARGQFAEIGQAGQAVDEARLLGERMFFRLKREATLLRWQVGAMRDDMVASPEIARAADDLQRLNELIDRLPLRVEAERKAILSAYDDRAKQIDQSVAAARAGLAEAEALARAVGPASESLSAMIKNAESLLVRFHELNRASGGPPARPFDIREHTEALKEMRLAADQVNQMLLTSNQMMASPEWGRRIEDINAAADGRISGIASHLEVVIDGFFRRLYFAIGVVVIIVVAFRLTTVLLRRRGNTGPLRLADEAPARHAAN